jgi:hypothetical protein
MRAGEEASDKGSGKRERGYKGRSRDMFLSAVDNMLVGWRSRTGGKDDCRARLSCGRHPLMYGAVWYSVVRLWNGW